MGYFSTYFGSKHALAANDRARAAEAAAAEEAVESDAAYKAFLVNSSLLGHSEVIAKITRAGTAEWDRVLVQLTIERNGYVNRKKLKIFLLSFLLCGLLSGILLSWNWLGIILFGVIFAAIITAIGGSFVSDEPARESGVKQINEHFASGGVDIEKHMRTLVQDQAKVAERLRQEMLGIAE
jgi:hypothetical protein